MFTAAPPSRGLPAFSRVTTTTSTATAPATKSRSDHNCGRCKRLGLGMDQHKSEWCYIDPSSKAFKPEVLLRRVAQA